MVGRVTIEFEGRTYDPFEPGSAGPIGLDVFERAVSLAWPPRRRFFEGL